MPELEKVTIFVFGSNQAGRHGAGAARTARDKFGAVYGRGSGLQGRSYAIPTKDWDLNPLPPSIIRNYVADFLIFATRHEHLVFNVTRIGCGRAGYTEEVIAPMFRGAPSNVILPRGWRALANVGGNGKDRIDLPGDGQAPD